MTVVPDIDFEMTKFTNSVIMSSIMGSSQWVNDLLDDIFFRNVYCLLKFHLNNGTFLLMFTLWHDVILQGIQCQENCMLCLNVDESII